MSNVKTKLISSDRSQIWHTHAKSYSKNFLFSDFLSIYCIYLEIYLYKRANDRQYIKITFNSNQFIMFIMVYEFLRDLSEVTVVLFGHIAAPLSHMYTVNYSEGLSSIPCKFLSFSNCHNSLTTCQKYLYSTQS